MSDTAAVARPVGNREKLLDAAMVCIAEKGYARTTARDLIAVSGANLASIGYHFGSKEALLNEAIARSIVTWTKAIEREVFATTADSTVDRLERMLQAVVDRFDELEPYLTAFVEAFPQAVRFDDLREQMAAAYQQAREAGGAMLRESLEGDGVRIGPAQAQTLASLLLAATDGLILQWLLEREKLPSSRDVIAALEPLLPLFQPAGAP